ncbi:hypothetical protein [Nibribacter koreensis]
MYVYLPAPGKLKHFRLAVEDGRRDDEVLLVQLPDRIQEVCLRDCPNCLEFIPAFDTETIMCVERNYEMGEQLTLDFDHYQNVA